MVCGPTRIQGPERWPLFIPALEPTRHEPPVLEEVGEVGEVSSLPGLFREACHRRVDLQSVVKMPYLDLLFRNDVIRDTPAGLPYK